jgi:hypothetical protein
VRCHGYPSEGASGRLSVRRGSANAGQVGQVCPRKYRQGRTCAVPPALEPEAVAALSSCWRRKSSLNRAWRLPEQIPEVRASSCGFPR